MTVNSNPNNETDEDDETTTTTTTNKKKRNLYELLDATSSGIAEWILPLVLAADLCVVEWIKPASLRCDQLPRGVQTFHVGAWCRSTKSESESESDSTATTVLPTVVESFYDLPKSAVVRVDWEHPYYWDDAVVVPTKELLLSKPVELHVSEIDDTNNSGHGNDPIPILAQQRCFSSMQNASNMMNQKQQQQQRPWILDICLDYFSCLNPYLVDIDDIDTEITDLLVDVMHRLHQITMSMMDDNSVAGTGTGAGAGTGAETTTTTAATTTTTTTTSSAQSRYRALLLNFRMNMTKFLLATNPIKSSLLLRDITADSSINTKHDILQCNDNNDDSNDPQQQSSMLTLLLMKFKERVYATDNVPQTLSLVTEALPFWNMPHKRRHNEIRKSNNGTEINTPANTSSSASSSSNDNINTDGGATIATTTITTSIADSLSNMEQILRYHNQNGGEEPFLITIARSCDDGFTPATEVEAIQNRVLRMLEMVYCNDNINNNVNAETTATSTSTTASRIEGGKSNNDRGYYRHGSLRITRDYGEWEGSTIF